jgi:hypothetical protein
MRWVEYVDSSRETWKACKGAGRKEVDDGRII